MCPYECMFDCVFANANVITMDAAKPSASLIALQGDRIAAVGGVEMLNALQSGSVRIVDCGGKTILPGFVDAHCHIHAYAENMISLDLSPAAGCCSIPDLQESIRRYCRRIPSGDWVRGNRYNDFYLAEGRHPNRWDLDAAAPLHPVKLSHRSGHAHVLNSLGLKQVGIDSGTGDPPGGLIDRDLGNGEPTGLLYGMHGFLSGRVPGVGDSEIERGIERVNSKLLSYGITSVQDASVANGLKQWKRFEEWKAKNIFRPRVTMMLGLDAFKAGNIQSYVSRLPGTVLRMGGVKVMVDRVTGNLRPAREELNDIVSSIHASGFQSAIHALEETVVEAGVDAIEYAMFRFPRADARHRIEHCSVCRPRTLRRLARLGGAVVSQPSFLFYEGDRYFKTVPQDQIERLYPFDAMIESGLITGAGSDAPLADPNPLVSIGTAAIRKSKEGQRFPREGISVMQAIRMHTLDAARANFEERIKGSITPGKLADFLVLDRNPFAVETEQIKDIRVVMTVLGGTIEWSDV